MEQKMVEETGKPAQAGLIIIGRAEKTLSKAQQNFNRLVKKLEKLRLELVQVGNYLDEKLDFYVKHIYHIEQQANELNKELVKLLYKFYKVKKLFSKSKKVTLGEIIAQKLDLIFDFQNEEPAEELKNIFKDVQGISYEDSIEEDFHLMKNEMEAVFGQFGADIDLDGFHSKMSEEEMLGKTTELEEQLRQYRDKEDKKTAAKKKSKKQQVREQKEKQKEEAHAKNISSIYKQLAKIFHPDLEQDPNLKLQKEELMKQLTNAYEKKDLHTLLRLELIWIQNEENDPANLTDQKLLIYNEVLREQILEVEEEIQDIYMHPRYEPLQKFGSYELYEKSSNLKQAKKQVEVENNTLTALVKTLNGNEKIAVSTIHQYIEAFELEDLMNKEFFGFEDDVLPY